MLTGSLMGDTTGGSQSDDEIPESQHGDTFHKQVNKYTPLPDSITVMLY